MSRAGLIQRLLELTAIRSLRAHKTVSGLLGALCLSLLTVSFNLFSIREDICQFPFPQPALSDFCGSISTELAPSRDERLAWQAIESTISKQGYVRCERLLAHLKQFEAGAYFREAIERKLSTEKTEAIGDEYCSESRRYPLYKDTQSRTYPDRSAAQQALTALLQQSAEQTCQRKIDNSHGRYQRAAPAGFDPQQISCQRASGGGWDCHYDGDIQCDYQTACRVRVCR